ncbi:MAG: DUF1595 domain-containing protein, partial [Myxococcota bacterium]|nr:DUF1595 domain-containing protein [Myxococcota bacterium]
MADAEAAAVLALSPEVAARYDACAAEPGLDRDCARSFVAAFARRAHRGPVDDARIDELLTTFDDALLEGAPTALQATLVRVLLDPEFLYRVELGGTPADNGTLLRLTPHEVANRLSFVLLDGPPSDTLL